MSRENNEHDGRSEATKLSEDASAKATEQGAVALEATDQGSAQSDATKLSEDASAKADKGDRPS